jgi:hypothetical protein
MLQFGKALLGLIVLIGLSAYMASTKLVQSNSIECNKFIGQFCLKLKNDSFTYGLTFDNAPDRNCSEVDGDKGKGE